MAVERSPATWFASTPSGICAHARDVDDWRLSFPPLRFDEPEIGDVEDILSLILTENWRFAGWLPIHAGCVVAPNGAAALLCAASGGGKSTLTAALIRAGWKTLGDDKLLLRTKPMPLAASLAASFNLDPATARWFPELAGVADLPRYSAWTNKRRVMVGDFWPGALIDTIAPSHIISIVRDDGAGFHIRKLGAREALRVLFDQVVVANDRQVAREIAQTLAQLAADASAFELRLGRDAYSAHSIAGCLEAALA